MRANGERCSTGRGTIRGTWEGRGKRRDRREPCGRWVLVFLISVLKRQSDHRSPRAVAESPDGGGYSDDVSCEGQFP